MILTKTFLHALPSNRERGGSFGAAPSPGDTPVIRSGGACSLDYKIDSPAHSPDCRRFFSHQIVIP